MPTRISASVAYGGKVGDEVDIEIDVSFTSAKEYDPDVERWRDATGQFTTPPSVTTDEIEQRARDVRDTAAANMRSRELKTALQNAEISVEDRELVGGRPQGQDNVVRIDPHNTGETKRYRVKGDDLEPIGDN